MPAVLFLLAPVPLPRPESLVFLRPWGGSGNSTSKILPIGRPAFAKVTGPLGHSSLSGFDWGLSASGSGLAMHKDSSGAGSGT